MSSHDNTEPPISHANGNEELRLRAACRIGFVNEVLPKNSVGIELGVMKGHFSEVLFNQLKPKELHLVDLWHLGSRDWAWAPGEKSTVDALINVLRHFRAEIDKGRVTVHVGDDLKVLQDFPDAYFDWAYIDSSHRYSHTLKELQVLEHKVKPAGVISGDDWYPDPSQKHHGVFRAVNAFIELSEFELFFTNDRAQWAIRRSD